MYITKWVAAVLWVEGERVTGVTSQESIQSAIESWSLFGKAWRLDIYEGREVGSGQWKTNTQMDADVLTTTQTLCKNKKKGRGKWEPK